MNETVKYEDLRAFVQQIEKDNAAFKAASKAEKRVIIAKDALVHYHNQHIVPTCGDYGSAMFPGAESESNIRDLLTDHDHVCEGCARGALVYSSILRRSGEKGSIFSGTLLPKEFTQSMFDTLEHIFEGDMCTPHTPLFEAEQLWHEWMWARAHYEVRVNGVPEREVYPDNYRFVAVMEFIIERKGRAFTVAEFMEHHVMKRLSQLREDVDTYEEASKAENCYGPGPTQLMKSWARTQRDRIAELSKQKTLLKHV